MSLAVEKILKEKGIWHQVIALSDKAFTVDDVVKFSKRDINPDEICKTIILRGKKSGNKLAVFLRGNDRLDFSKVKKLCGEEMAIASAEEVKEASGVEPGAVCPFLLSVPLYVDSGVQALNNINCGSGDHLYGLEFKFKDMDKVVSYKIEDLAKSNQ